MPLAMLYIHHALGQFGNRSHVLCSQTSMSCPSMALGLPLSQPVQAMRVVANLISFCAAFVGQVRGPGSELGLGSGPFSGLLAYSLLGMREYLLATPV